jgi:hypothetical protein
MHALVADFLAANPECRFRALGVRANRDALDLAPFGHAIDFIDAAEHPTWVDRYHAANLARFTGRLSLPGWVLVDLYLMPAAIGLLTCPAHLCDVRPQGLADDDEAIAAAYYAAPSVVPGTVIGVSLISMRKRHGGAAIVKAMTLGMLRAQVQRGIAQWNNPALRVHTRLGPLRVEGPVPAAHGKAAETFVYSVDLADAAALEAAMRRPAHAGDPDPPEGARWIGVNDHTAIAEVFARARTGEPMHILPPGLSRDGEKVLVRVG